MFFNLLHAFLLFAGITLLVRLSMPAQYVLLNPYAAMLDNLLTRLFRTLATAIPLPVKGLCALLFVLVLCADAVMLSRLNAATMAVSAFAVFALPCATFTQWLLIAVLNFFQYFLTILATNLFLQAWHRKRLLPGYTGDLLRLAIHPLQKMPLVGQILTLFAGTTLLAYLLMCNATSVLYPFEMLQASPNGFGNFADIARLSAMESGFRFIAVSGLIALEVFAKLHSFTATLIFFALLSMLFRSQSFAFFIKDVFRLLAGPLPEVRFGFVVLTPLLTLLVFFVLGGFLPVLFVWILKLIAIWSGAYVV